MASNRRALALRLGVVAVTLLGPAVTSCSAGPIVDCSVAGSITGNPQGRVTEYPANLEPAGIAKGPDGNLWVADSSQIERVTPAGMISYFPYDASITGACMTYCGAGDITAGPDGKLWFTSEAAGTVGTITPDGQMVPQWSQWWALGVTGDTWTQAITAGPDGNLWFTVHTLPRGTSSGAASIDRLTAKGSITAFPVATADDALYGITAGPDGALWFTDDGNNQIGRITITGQITTFSLPTIQSGAYGITVGPDGNLWFTERYGNKIGRITPTGQVTEYPVPSPIQLTCDQEGPLGITAGPDGNLWFAEDSNNKIGRITPGGKITEFQLPTAHSEPHGITLGPDGALWFTEFKANQVGSLTP
jgi:virginiamycin B lyase